MVPVLVQHNTIQITCGWQCFAFKDCNGTPWLSDERLHRAQNSRACFSALFLQFTVLHIYLDACGNDSNAVVVCMFACVRACACLSHFLLSYRLLAAWRSSSLFSIVATVLLACFSSWTLLLPTCLSTLKVRPHRTRSAAADCGLCPLRNVTF